MNPDLIRPALALLAVGGLLEWSALVRFRKLRSIQDTARSKAASAPQGHVELQGIAWPEGEGARQSSSGAEVVHHSLRIEREEKRGTGRHRHTTWVGVFRKDFNPQFFLADGTGLVRVDPVGAELDLATTSTRGWRSLSKAERQRVLACLDGRTIDGFPPPEFLFGLFGSRFRIVESEIRVGSPLYARGEFRTTEGAPERVRTRGLTQFHGRFFDPARREQKPLDAVLDGDGDGKVSAKEAIDGLCRAAASDRAATETMESEFPVHGRLATSPQHKLFVADRHEEHLVANIGRTVHLPLAAGVLALSAGLFLMVGNFGSGSKVVPATSAPGSPGVHDALRGRCLGGQAAACDELLRRATELRVSDVYRRDYARQACTLGLRQHCPAAAAP